MQVLAARSNISSIFASRQQRRASVRAHAAETKEAEVKHPHGYMDMDHSLEAMRHFSEQYARRSGTYFCMDLSVTAVVIKGLAEHKAALGAPLCPCRHYDDKEAEVSQGFWNCPCVPMRERKECHCMLFLTEDNDFAGKEQAITLAEVKAATEGM